MTSIHLHQQIVQHLWAIGVRIPQPQLVNLALLTQALAVSPNCHLPTLALHMPIEADRDSVVQHIRRYLRNPHVTQWRCYGPVVRHLFRYWQGVEVPLVMDRTDLGDRWSILTLGVACGHRCLPLAWEVLPFGGTSGEVQVNLLRQVRLGLPSSREKRISFFADAEFRSVDVQAYCRSQQYHWHVGLKSDIRFSPDGQTWLALAEIPLQPGQRRAYHGVQLTQQHAFGPVNLIADWPKSEEAPRYWSLDLPADRFAWRRGRKRFWIEPSFRDWKSYGFDLETTQIDDPDCLEVLLLGMSLASVWMIHLGQWVIRSGGRHRLEARHKRDYSLFRLGRDYVQRAFTLGWPIPVGFTVSHELAH